MAENWRTIFLAGTLWVVPGYSSEWWLGAVAGVLALAHSKVAVAVVIVVLLVLLQSLRGTVVTQAVPSPSWVL